MQAAASATAAKNLVRSMGRVMAQWQQHTMLGSIGTWKAGLEQWQAARVAALVTMVRVLAQLVLVSVRGRLVLWVHGVTVWRRNEVYDKHVCTLVMQMVI